MTAIQFVKILTTRWPSVVAGVVTGLLIATLVTLAIPATYASSGSVYIAPQVQEATASSAYQGSLLSEARVRSYVALLGSYRVADDVSARLGGTPVPADVKSALSASADPDTVIITIRAEANSPELAAALAQTTMDVFSSTVAQLEQPLDPTRPPSVTSRVLERPFADPTPASPRPLLNLLAGLIFGLLAGAFIAVLRERSDSQVRSTDAMGEAAGAPALGAVPRLADSDATNSSLLSRTTNGFDIGAEAIRKIRANLQFVKVDRENKCLLVTSSLPGEGKTTFARLLAGAFASQDLEVLLIDADLRKPRLGAYLGLDSSVGLSDVLAGRVDVTEALQRVGSTHLSVLLSGSLPPHPSELLASDRMTQLLGDVRGRFAVVIIDSPPVLPVSDPAVLGGLVDGAILVVRHDYTTADQVGAASNALVATGTTVLGGVLTGVPVSTSRRSATYSTYYYEDRAATTPAAPSASAAGAASAADVAEPGTVWGAADTVSDRPGDDRPSPVRRHRAGQVS